MSKVRIAVVGTGSIGVVHADRVVAGSETELAVLCGLDSGAPGLAERLDVPLVRDFTEIVTHQIDAVIVATPNKLHAEMGLWLLDHGLPVLLEKPITESVESGSRLCDIAAQTGLPLLIGHHRRYNPMVTRAREAITDELGKLIGTTTMITFRKPDSYYEAKWRRSIGAGPLLINLIHEVDLLRFICDEIVSVQSATRQLNRPWDFEDTAAITVHYRSGAVGTIFVSDSVPAPWSWEAAMNDGMDFYSSGQDYLSVMGTDGSLSIPSLTLWYYDENEPEPGWRSPLQSRQLDVVAADPYARQIAHFARVVRGMETPVVDGADGLRSLAVVEAIIEAGKTGRLVEVGHVLDR